MPTTTTTGVCPVCGESTIGRNRVGRGGRTGRPRIYDTDKCATDAKRARDAARRDAARNARDTDEAT